MFPPSSPMMERIRVKADMHELERKAIWNAHFRQRNGWRLPKIFSFRWRRPNQQSMAAICPAHAERKPETACHNVLQT